MNQSGMLHALSVDSGTGALAAASAISLSDSITDLAVEPLGEFLYATTSALQQFALDASGSPALGAQYPIGSFPSSVTVALAHASSAATLQSLAIVPADLTIYSSLPGKQRQFVAVGSYSDGTSAFLTQSVSWNSSNPALATIDATGLATTITVPGIDHHQRYPGRDQRNGDAHGLDPAIARRRQPGIRYHRARCRAGVLRDRGLPGRHQ